MTILEIVLPKTSSIWKKIAALEAFKGKRIPHFKPLLTELPLLRETEVIGLVDSFIWLLKTIENLINDISRSTLDSYKKKQKLIEEAIADEYAKIDNSKTEYKEMQKQMNDLHKQMDDLHKKIDSV
ncbi:unnamed protein product [Arabis nemorensis]|uniref:Uncharacterized protein n=1 Tax=Arabis nemorensis TaxID=586526 RepID=A0A565CMS4_9BRAS|nr:unnamed protein product [Arabis nemorensis]